MPRNDAKSVLLLVIKPFSERVEIFVEKMPIDGECARRDAWPITDCTAFRVAPAEIIAAAALCRVTWTPAVGKLPISYGSLFGWCSMRVG
jgi:hypothetical protein